MPMPMALDDIEIEIEVEDTGSAVEMMPGSGMEINMNEMMGNMMPKKFKRRIVSVDNARKIFKQEEAGKLIDMDQVKQEAKDLTENLNFSIFASENTPLVNLPLVIKNWGNAEAGLRLNGNNIVRGKNFRYGHRNRPHDRF